MKLELVDHALLDPNCKLTLKKICYTNPMRNRVKIPEIRPPAPNGPPNINERKRDGSVILGQIEINISCDASNLKKTCREKQ